MSYWTLLFKSHFHISEVIAVFESTAALWYKWHFVLLRKIIHFKFRFGNTSGANLDQWTAGSEGQEWISELNRKKFSWSSEQNVGVSRRRQCLTEMCQLSSFQLTENKSIVKRFDSKVNFFSRQKSPWRIAFGISFHTVAYEKNKQNWDSLLSRNKSSNSVYTEVLWRRKHYWIA